MSQAAAAIERLLARQLKLEEAVEQAFRDGMIYGNNVTVTDPDEAWRTSRARQALKDTPS